MTAVSGTHFTPMRDNVTFNVNEHQKFIRLELTKKDFSNDEGFLEIFVFVILLVKCRSLTSVVKAK